MPATLTNALVDDRLDDADAADGFILDGFPRSVEQAEALHDMLERRNLCSTPWWSSGSPRTNWSSGSGPRPRR